MGGYNSETFYINPKAERIVTQKRDDGYFAYNVGKSTVTIAIIQGNAFGWTNTIATNPIVPGQGCAMNIGRRTGYIGVKVINHDNINGFVHVAGVNTGYADWDDSSHSYFNLDDNDLLTTVVTYGAGRVPVVGDVLSPVIEFFWPSTGQPNPWDQIKHKVIEVVDKNTHDTITETMGSLASLEEILKRVAREVDDPNITNTVPEHYMKIAEELVGFEKQFIFDEHSDVDYVKANYVLLPLWATFLNLKLSFYQFAIANQQKVGLEDEHIVRIKDYITRVVTDPEGAVEHVNKVYKDKMNDEYVHAYSGLLYDQLATVRAYCALNGFQNLVVWKAIAENPENTKKPYNPVVIFSTQFGRNNAIQSRVQVAEDIPPPLQPKEIDGKLNIPTIVDVILSSESSPNIGGLKITYANGETETTGRKISGETKVVDFGGKDLAKLTAHGSGKISALEFTFDDGSTESAGTIEGDKREFALDKHRIVGFFMTGCKKMGENVSTNIAVGYQLIPEKDA